MNIEKRDGEKEIVIEKKHYTPPKLTILGDVAEITMGLDIGEDLDAMFVMSSSADTPRGKSKKRDLFS